MVNLFQTLLDSVFFIFILQFILVFAVIYGVLQKTKLFDKKVYNVSIALLFGIIATVYGYYTGCVDEIVKAFVLSLVVILVLILLIGAFVKDKKVHIILGFVIVIGVFYFVFSGSDKCPVGVLLSTDLLLPIIIVIVVVLLFVWIFSHKQKEEPDKAESKPSPERREKPRGERSPPRREEPRSSQRRAPDIDEDLRAHVRPRTPRDDRDIEDLTGPETSS
jgi:vacuolar-type H+-ATPase subunit I/STV1